MKTNKNAFTLAELVIVLAVIGILAAILIPVFSNVITNTNAKSALLDARDTAEQYVMNVHEDKNAPEAMVIAVQKGGNYWLFGYDRDASHNNNRLMISDNNPYSEKEFMKNAQMTSVMDKWSFNSKHPGEVPDNSGDTVYDANTDGTFWLVPYYENGAEVYDVRSVPSYEDEKYLLLNSSASTIIAGSSDVNGEFTDDGEELGSDGDILAYHGLLLPGTYTLDQDDVSSDITDLTKTYSLSFLIGEPKFNPTEYGTKVPETIQIPAGTTVFPATYQIDNVPSGYTYSWDKTTAFIMNRNVTLTAQWLTNPERTVIFKLSDDASFDDTTKAAAKAAIEAAGFKWSETGKEIKIESGSTKLYDGQSIKELLSMTANKADASFTGWHLTGGSIYNGSNIIPVAGDMEFTSVFSTDTVHVVIDPNNGGLNEKTEQDISVGATVVLSLSNLSISSPSGQVFSHWSWTINNEQLKDGAEIQIYDDVTITANWMDYELTVRYADDVPSKANSAKLSAKIPDDVTYTSENMPSSITVGGASLKWYNVQSYAVLMPDGTSQTVNEGGTVAIPDMTAGTILITPSYTAMTATIRYEAGSYNIDNWLRLVPGDTTYELIDIRDGYKLCANNLTCNENFSFEGWRDSADSTSHIYAPKAIYEINESHAGTTITFIACFNEDELQNGVDLVFKFYDYQNYPDDREGHTLFEYEAFVTYGTVIDADLMSNNMPTKQDLRDAGKQIIVTSKLGAEYEAELVFCSDAELLGDYEPITVTEEISEGTEIWIPSCPVLEIDNEQFFVLYTKDGFTRMDMGYVNLNGTLYGTTGGSYVLANDIELSGNTTPVGFGGSNNPHYIFDYEGHFNGLGYTISGFHFNPGVNNDYVGLFSSVAEGATVENFKLEVDGTVSGYDFTGAVAGWNDGTIKDVIVDLQEGSCLSGYIVVGGICGCNRSLIENCHITTSFNSTRHIMARGAQMVDTMNTETVDFGNYGSGEEFSGTFLGGIAGGNDHGTITKCSVSGNNGATFGIHANRVGAYTDSYGYIAYYRSGYIGGIAGANVGGMVDQCWTYNMSLCREYRVSNGYMNKNVTGLEYIGGITGSNEFSATVQHCWSRNAVMSGYNSIGGISGAHNRKSKMTDCWVIWGGAEFTGSSANVGDLVSKSCVKSSASVSNCVICEPLNGSYAPSSAKIVNTLSDIQNVEPSSLGLNSSYFMSSANGPMLIHNPYATSWVID